MFVRGRNASQHPPGQEIYFSSKAVKIIHLPGQTLLLLANMIANTLFRSVQISTSADQLATSSCLITGSVAASRRFVMLPGDLPQFRYPRGFHALPPLKKLSFTMSQPRRLSAPLDPSTIEHPAGRYARMRCGKTGVTKKVCGMHCKM